MEKIGHAKRITKTIIVKKKAPRKAWTNRTTKTVKKFCSNHNKICEFSEKAKLCKETRREKYNQNKKNKNQPTNKNIKCIKCNTEKTANNFYVNPSNKNGRANVCKTCKKEYDKKRNDTWPVLIRAAYRQSINAHGNENGENKISLEECKKLLEEQKYKCKHCRCELTCKQGSVINCSYKRASLDRIDTSKVGYKNNAQWLCVSCNKGKCTMPDEEHKKKFSILFDKIDYLEKLLSDHNIEFKNK